MPLLRFEDLKARGVVSNRMTLWRWIRYEGFPAGIRLGPNSIAWDEEEVETWIARRPRVETASAKTDDAA